MARCAPVSSAVVWCWWWWLVAAAGDDDVGWPEYQFTGETTLTQPSSAVLHGHNYLLFSAGVGPGSGLQMSHWPRASVAIETSIWPVLGCDGCRWDDSVACTADLCSGGSGGGGDGDWPAWWAEFVPDTDGALSSPSLMRNRRGDGLVLYYTVTAAVNTSSVGGKVVSTTTTAVPTTTPTPPLNHTNASAASTPPPTLAPTSTPTPALNGTGFTHCIGRAKSFNGSDIHGLRWRDSGRPVVCSSGLSRAQPVASDPAPFHSPDGQLWLVFGAGGGGIFLAALDRGWDGNASSYRASSAVAGRAAPGYAAGGVLHEVGTEVLANASYPGQFTFTNVTQVATHVNHGEQAIRGAFMYYHHEVSMFYLFVTWTNHSPANGTIGLNFTAGSEIRVGRSPNVTGPFVDKQGDDLVQGGGSLFFSEYKRGSRYHGPHQPGIFEINKTLPDRYRTTNSTNFVFTFGFTDGWATNNPATSGGDDNGGGDHEATFGAFFLDFQLSDSDQALVDDVWVIRDGYVANRLWRLGLDWRSGSSDDRRERLAAAYDRLLKPWPKLLNKSWDPSSEEVVVDHTSSDLAWELPALITLACLCFLVGGYQLYVELKHIDFSAVADDRMREIIFDHCPNTCRFCMVRQVPEPEALKNRYDDCHGAAQHLFESLRVTEDQQQQLFAIWDKIDQDMDNTMSFEEFVQFFDLSRFSHMWTTRLFDLFCPGSNGFISFVDFVSSIFDFCVFDTEKTYQLAFRLMSRRGQTADLQFDVIDQRDIHMFVEDRYQANGLTDLKVQSLAIKVFQFLDEDCNGGVSLREFQSACRRYRVLQVTAYELQTQLRRGVLGEKFWLTWTLDRPEQYLHHSHLATWLREFSDRDHLPHDWKTDFHELAERQAEQRKGRRLRKQAKEEASARAIERTYASLCAVMANVGASSSKDRLRAAFRRWLYSAKADDGGSPQQTAQQEQGQQQRSGRQPQDEDPSNVQLPSIHEMILRQSKAVHDNNVDEVLHAFSATYEKNIPLPSFRKDPDPSVLWPKRPHQQPTASRDKNAAALAAAARLRARSRSRSQSRGIGGLGSGGDYSAPSTADSRLQAGMELELPSFSIEPQAPPESPGGWPEWGPSRPGSSASLGSTWLSPVGEADTWVPMRLPSGGRDSTLGVQPWSRGGGGSRGSGEASTPLEGADGRPGSGDNGGGLWRVLTSRETRARQRSSRGSALVVPENQPFAPAPSSPANRSLLFDENSLLGALGDEWNL